jgi:hypothetical protein
MVRNRWLVIALAALLLTPAGAVIAQDGNETANETEEDDEFETNESSTNESEADEEDEEAEEEDEAGEARARASSDWEHDNGTYTGEHIQVTVDEELPGLQDVTYLDPDAAVFASVELVGDEFEHHARGSMLVGETDENEVTVRDDDGGHLMLEADDEASIAIEVADGVNVTEPDRYDDGDEDEGVYELQLAENRTAWFHGEGLSYDNATFTLNDEAKLSPSFAAEEAGEDEPDEADEERRSEPDEADSQWDRSNGTFEGDHVSFQLNADEGAISDYAVDGDTVFASASLPGADEQEWRAHGKHFELRQDDTRIRIVDVPPAVLELRGEDEASAQLVLADGVEATEIATDDNDTDENETDDEDEGVYELTFGDNRTAWLAGEDLNRTDDGFATSDELRFRTMPQQAGASADQDPGSVADEAERDDEERGAPEDRGPDGEDEAEAEDEERGPPEQARARPMDPESRATVEQAKAAGQVGAEVRVAGEDPVAVEMGDVEVQDAWAEDEDGLKAGMEIQAPDDAGPTTVTMDLQDDALEGVNVTEAADELEVAFDNETIAMADDLEDVLDASDDDGEPEYLVMAGSDGVEVLVSVPHFSPHTVEVYQTQSSGEQLDGNQVPGLGAVGAVLATALAGLAVRRER